MSAHIWCSANGAILVTGSKRERWAASQDGYLPLLSVEFVSREAANDCVTALCVLGRNGGDRYYAPELASGPSLDALRAFESRVKGFAAAAGEEDPR